MRMPALILIVMAAAPPMAPVSPQERGTPPLEELPPPAGLQPAKAQGEGPAKTIKELQQERIDTLKQVVDTLTARSRLPGTGRGNVSTDEVLEAQLLLFKAKLDAAEKESDRIALYKNRVEMLKRAEELAIRQRESARSAAVAVLKIKARRLEAQIDLEGAKAKEAKKAK